ncbi:cold-shock DNA-binding domain protein [Aggregatibacter actinomycetemcomitans Y4]|nr:cold-shock DNA-binding domain protein [Aggregatibacter actinomycetemcomitans Y4]
MQKDLDLFPLKAVIPISLAHYSVIEMEGYRSLKAGQKVRFEVIHGDKGSHATKIIPVVE